MTLPHDYSIEQDYTVWGEAESGFLPGGTGWYRKSFTLDENQQGSRVYLNFDGVYSDAYVYVNGQYLGEHHYGYTRSLLILQTPWSGEAARKMSLPYGP